MNKTFRTIKDKKTQAAPVLWTPQDPKVALERFAMREELVAMLYKGNPNDSIAAAVAYLLHAAEKHQVELRTVLQNTVDRPDGRRARMVDVITQVVR